MRSLPQPDNRVYLGRGGSGKTTLALAHAEVFPRVVILDPNGEEGHAEGALVTDDRGELVAFLGQPGPLRVCWRIDPAIGPDAAFDWLNRVAWAAGNLVVVWDEADMFMSAHRLPGAAYRLWNMGRHRRVRVFACSRRAARLSRDCTANVSRACVFRSTEPADLRFLAELMEEEAAAAVRGLAPYHYVEWTPYGWGVKTPVNG